MTLLYMLDSNFCIRLLRHRPAGILQRFNAEAPHLSLSTIVLHELMFGAEISARRSENLNGIEQLVARLTVLPFDDNAAGHSAEIRASLQRVGMTIDTLDTMIAGHARSLGLIVVSNNLREFSRVDGLRTEDWQ